MYIHRFRSQVLELLGVFYRLASHHFGQKDKGWVCNACGMVCSWKVIKFPVKTSPLLLPYQHISFIFTNWLTCWLESLFCSSQYNCTWQSIFYYLNNALGLLIHNWKSSEWDYLFFFFNWKIITANCTQD